MGFPLRLAERRPKAPEAALLGLLRGVPLLPLLEKSWPEIRALAEAHRVAALLHAVAPELPEKARQDLLRARSAAQAVRARQQAALLRLSGALEGAGALVIRGAAHAEDLYAAPELRPLSELEMLIPPSRTFAALDRLSRRGYRLEDRPAKGWLVLRLSDPRDQRVRILLRRGFPPPAGVPAPPSARSSSEPEVRSALPVGALCLRAQGVRLDPSDALLVQALALDERGMRVPLIEIVDFAHLFVRSDPAVAISRARQARLLAQLGAALRLLELCAAAAPRFGGAPLDLARIPRLEVPEELERAALGYELSAEADRPGALLQVARALGLVAEQRGV
ncbi:MAG TPA: nucleotidyltransferase family protein [Myxococcales bacterium]|nr:nucleotidyltransferase family protein [Myxococcales bacterium]